MCHTCRVVQLVSRAQTDDPQYAISGNVLQYKMSLITQHVSDP